MVAARRFGSRVGRSRKVRCPLHEDRTASLHVYREPERGWYCSDLTLYLATLFLAPRSSSCRSRGRASGCCRRS
jgi:hypothetical protein